MDGSETHTYRFDRFQLDVEERRLLNVGVRVPLSPKIFDTLVFLVEHAGRLISKDELIRAIWSDAFVEEGNLSRNVYDLRKALGDDKDGNSFIETVPKFGYRFVAQIHRPESTAPSDTAAIRTDDASLQAVRVYRRKGEFDRALVLAEKCLLAFKASGDRGGIVEAFREISACHNLKGNYLKSIENCEYALQTISPESNLLAVGKLYADIASAYWALRRHDASLEFHAKAIFHLTKCACKPGLVSAYGNLGFLLIQLGYWKHAETELRKGIEIALASKDANTSGILDSLAELFIRQGKLEEAIPVLHDGIAAAREQGRGVGVVMRNLSRCLLKQGLLTEAYRTASEAMRLCGENNDKRYLLYSRLVLAETCLRQGSVGECEAYLTEIEMEGMGADFFVFGECQRIRGLASLEVVDTATALKHFLRSRAIFEKDSDIYHTAVADFLIGANAATSNALMAREHLKKATMAFEKLSLEELQLSSASMLEKLGGSDRK